MTISCLWATGSLMSLYQSIADDSRSGQIGQISFRHYQFFQVVSNNGKTRIFRFGFFLDVQWSVPFKNLKQNNRMSNRCLRERVSIDQECEWDKLLRASERERERERETDEICQKQKARYLKF